MSKIHSYPWNPPDWRLLEERQKKESTTEVINRAVEMLRVAADMLDAIATPREIPEAPELPSPEAANYPKLVAQRIQAGLAEALPGMTPPKPDADAVAPIVAEVIRYGLPLEAFFAEVARLVARDRETNPAWLPNGWGWARVFLATQARRLGKIHAGEVQPDPPTGGPTPGTVPRFTTTRTGGRITGMSRPGKFRLEAPMSVVPCDCLLPESLPQMREENKKQHRGKASLALRADTRASHLPRA